MAFRTNKVPAIEERTVSGSSVSFNSAFALPLKACKVSFSATQSGSGTPSPQNVRPIIPVSSVDLSANSVSVIVPLGDSYGGGSLNLLTGKAEITYVLSLIKDLNLQYDSSTNTFFVYTTDKAYGALNIIAEVLETINVSVTNMPNYSIKGGPNNRVIYIKVTDYTTVASLKEAIGDYRIHYELETPIELSLTPTQLSAIVGNNTFSTDTGTLEITFADLQEKSASGAVASFNTALAMPLVECKTEFMCTQESGTPSPSNPLAITGVDSVAITANGNSIVIDLGGTRYGGYVDVVGKKGYGTWNYLYINDASDAEIFAYNNMNGIRFPNRCPRSNRQSGISNMSAKVGRDFSSGALWCGVLTNDSSLYWVGILDILNMTLDQFKLWIVDHPLEVAYQIQLETDYTVIDLDIPTLSTIIGNNSFASDSGSIELKYKDLDIAKRGNFREVFKLPS